MGRKARQRQRDAGLRKQPNEPKQPFVAGIVGILRAMDAELQAAMNQGGSPSELQGP